MIVVDASALLEFPLQTPLGTRIEARLLHRHAHLDLLTRTWKLRDIVTAYDAMYVALGEALDATVVTCDTPLARAPGHRTHIELIV